MSKLGYGHEDKRYLIFHDGCCEYIEVFTWDEAKSLLSSGDMDDVTDIPNHEEAFRKQKEETNG